MKKIILSLIMVAAIMLSNFVVAQEEIELSKEDLMYEVASAKLMEGYVHEEKMDSAIADFKEIIKLYPDYIDAHVAIGDALSYKSYSVLGAIKNQALSEEGRDSLKISYSNLLIESLYYFKEAYEIDNRNLLVLEWMSSLYLRIGKNKEHKEMKKLYDSLRVVKKG